MTAGSIACFFFWVFPAIWFDLTRSYFRFDNAAFEISFGTISAESGLLVYHDKAELELISLGGTRQMKELLNSHPSTYVLFVGYMCPFMFAVWVDIKLAWRCFRTARLLGHLKPPDPKEIRVLDETWVQRHRRLGIVSAVSADLSEFRSPTSVASNVRQSGAAVALHVGHAGYTAARVAIAAGGQVRRSSFTLAKTAFKSTTNLPVSAPESTDQLQAGVHAPASVIPE